LPGRLHNPGREAAAPPSGRVEQDLGQRAPVDVPVVQIGGEPAPLTQLSHSLDGPVHGHKSCASTSMPEVGPGVGLERFELVAQGDVYCVIDVVDQEVASIVLTALPEFPLELEAEKARRFVEAWRQRANVAAEPYEVRRQQREI
jgi:hypothetical protein